MGSQPPPLKEAQPQFSVHVYCGQTAGWIKTPLGTEVALGPGHIVLDEDPAPPRKGNSSPLVSARVYYGHGRPSQLLLSSCLFVVLIIHNVVNRHHHLWYSAANLICLVLLK